MGWNPQLQFQICLFLLSALSIFASCSLSLCCLVCIHLESLCSFTFGSFIIVYLRRGGYVSNGSLIFRDFAILLWSTWFILYCLGSYWSLLMLPNWAEQVFPDQPGMPVVGKACVGIVLSVPLVALIAPVWKQKSQPMDINGLPRLGHLVWLHPFFLFCLCPLGGEENLRLMR